MRKTGVVKNVKSGAIKEPKLVAPEAMLMQISDIFLKFGLRSTSMDDICTHLKISKKTLYNYFDSKDHVVESVLRFRMKGFDLEKFKSKAEPLTAIQILTNTAKQVSQAMKSQVPQNNLDALKYHPVAYHKVTSLWMEQMTDVLSYIFIKGKQEGTFRPEIDVDMQAYLIINQYRAFNKPIDALEIKYPVKDLVYAVFENTIRTLATPKGIAEMESILKR